MKMVVPEVVETRDMGYKPTEMFSFLQRGGDALEIKKVQCLSSTRGLSKDKRAFKNALRAD